MMESVYGSTPISETILGAAVAAGTSSVVRSRSGKCISAILTVNSVLGCSSGIRRHNVRGPDRSHDKAPAKLPSGTVRPSKCDLSNLTTNTLVASLCPVGKGSSPSENGHSCRHAVLTSTGVAAASVSPTASCRAKDRGTVFGYTRMQAGQVVPVAYLISFLA